MMSGDPDPRAVIVDAETFTLAVELEVRQAIRLQYYVSLLVLQGDTPVQVDWPPLYHRIAEVIRDEIRNTDVVSVVSTPPHLRVLLVSPCLENLPAIIARITVAVSGRAFETEVGEVRVALSVGGACFPTTARSRAELFRQAESLSAEARAATGKPGHRYRLAEPAL
jgi:hypothetical protein